MPVFPLSSAKSFPPVELADPDGLLAVGGDLSKERIMEAYKRGIFPWYGEDEPICWWSPDPRFVLFPEELKISKSMRPLLNQRAFAFTVNRAFGQVIHQCRMVKREGQPGTWITPEIEKAYSDLHADGYAISAEAWKNKELVGGLYGIRMGNMFFGESMFSLEPNASKYAFIKLVDQLKKEGVVCIDCQVYTAHLESLGARMIPRKDFIQLLTI